jgi:hypothetical protein
MHWEPPDGAILFWFIDWELHGTSLVHTSSHLCQWFKVWSEWDANRKFSALSSCNTLKSVDLSGFKLFVRD